MGLRAVVGPSTSGGVYDVAAPFLKRRDQHRDVLGLILEIRVHQDQDIALRVIESGSDSRVLPEVSREADDLEPRISGCLSLEQRQRAVAAAVVNDDGLVVKSVKGRSEPLDELIDSGLVVVDRNEIDRRGAADGTVSAGRLSIRPLLGGR